MADTQVKRRVLRGVVVSDAMDKTIVVEVETARRHPVVEKVIRRHKRYKVHDEHGRANVGDTVTFYEGRPVSKTKYMYLHEVLVPAHHGTSSTDQVAE